MKNIRLSLMALAAMITLATTACKNEKAATTAPVVEAPKTVGDVMAANTQGGTSITPTPINTTPGANTPATVTPGANGAAPAAVPSGPATEVKFAEVEHDWGTIKEGDKMVHIFKFTNTGKEPLIISDAKASCGCTVPEWPTKPIAPGAKGEIKVEFDSSHKPGDQMKTVTVTANTTTPQTFLTIKGKVKPDPTKAVVPPANLVEPAKAAAH
jgi:Protein of unknown function (DUF1573)